MRWEKKGLIFTPPKTGWMNSHAQVPTVLVKEDCIRVYFAARPNQGLSQTTFADLDKNDFSKVIYLHPDPILPLGEKGCFDEHGVMPASVLEYNGMVYLYYSGWQRSVGVPYNNYTGLAISSDGGKTFRKVSRGPVIDRTMNEIYSATSPAVIRDGDLWHMWYSSGKYWHEINGKLEHTYDLCYAFSKDGITWNQTGESHIPQATPFEAITRPSVIKINGKWYMWYSYRGSKNFRGGADAYKIGLAVSDDLKKWERKDSESGMAVSAGGWDSEMAAYGDVKKIGDRIFMFYNGNDFGKEGFGLAELIL